MPTTSSTELTISEFTQARPFYERHTASSLPPRLTNDRFGRTWFVMEKRL